MTVHKLETYEAHPTLKEKTFAEVTLLETRDHAFVNNSSAQCMQSSANLAHSPCRNDSVVSGSTYFMNLESEAILVIHSPMRCFGH